MKDISHAWDRSMTFYTADLLGSWWGSQKFLGAPADIIVDDRSPFRPWTDAVEDLEASNNFCRQLVKEGKEA